MNYTTVAKRYAKALAEVAIERKMEDQMLQELTDVNAMIESNAELAQLLQSPAMAQERAEAAPEILARMGLSAPVHAALQQIVEFRRSKALPEIINQYRMLVDESRGRLHVAAITTQRLSAADRQAIEARLQSLTGKHVALEERIDPGIIGGLVVKFGDTVIDGSVRTQLETVKNVLAQER